MKRGERGPDALALRVGDQARQHLAELRVPCARMDVLPAVSIEERGLDRPHLGITNRTAASRDEVAGVGLGLRLEDAIHRADQLNEFVDRAVALLHREFGVVAHPLELVKDGVLAFLPPVIEEHVLEQLRELGVGIDALAVMELGEQFDVERQRQHRPGRLAKHGAGDAVGVDVEAITFRQHLADHCVDPAEQGLVLEFLVAKAHQRLERDLVAEPVIVAQLQNLGVDEAFDQAEDVGVGPALDLADEPLLAGRQRREGVCQHKPVGKEFVGGVEAASPDHVLLDLPAHPLGRLDAARIPLGGGNSLDRIHCPSPFRSDAPTGRVTRPTDAII